MSNVIDWSGVVTAEDKARAAAFARADLIKAACSARIVAVLDHNTVANIQGALLIGSLTDAEKAVFAAGHAWVGATVDACRSLIQSPAADFLADGAWPDLPEGVEELAMRF